MTLGFGGLLTSENDATMASICSEDVFDNASVCLVDPKVASVCLVDPKVASAMTTCLSVVVVCVEVLSIVL